MRYYITLISLALLSLTACAKFSHQKVLAHRERQYLTAAQLPLLKAPPGMASIKNAPEMMIPIRHDSEDSKRIDLTPPGLSGNS